MANFDYDIAFQPIVSLSPEKGYAIDGHEVLSRFRNENTQNKIISLEKSGQIAQFDLDLIQKVMVSPELSQGRLSVNISNASLHNSTFLRDFENLVSGFRNKNIDFEVTETFQPNIKNINRLVEVCHANGFRVGLDDYGSGHSNFDLVRSADFDFIKIDGSLVKTYDNSFVSRGKVMQLADYCKSKDLPLTAEFISDIKQIDQFHAIGVTKGQGVLFGLAGPEPLTNSKVRANILTHDVKPLTITRTNDFKM